MCVVCLMRRHFAFTAMLGRHRLPCLEVFSSKDRESLMSAYIYESGQFLLYSLPVLGPRNTVCSGQKSWQPPPSYAVNPRFWRTWSTEPSQIQRSHVPRSSLLSAGRLCRWWSERFSTDPQLVYLLWSDLSTLQLTQTMNLGLQRLIHFPFPTLFSSGNSPDKARSLTITWYSMLL